MRCFECGEKVDGTYWMMPIPKILGGTKSLYFCEDDFIFVGKGISSYEQSERIKKALAIRKEKGILLGRPRLHIPNVKMATSYRLHGYSWSMIARIMHQPAGTLRRRIIEYLKYSFYSDQKEIERDIKVRETLKGEIKCQQSERPQNSGQSF